MPKPLRLEPALDILNSPASAWIKTAEERAQMTIACQDGADIPRVKDAGSTKVVDGQKVQLMHNGLKVLQGGYQGDWQVELVKQLHGIHEPQEEKVFYEVLKRIRPKANMLELGSWWSYYSMWFLHDIKHATAYCCEPDPENLALGHANARLNDFDIGTQIIFHQYAAGSQNNKKISFPTLKGETVEVPIRTIDSIVEQEAIDKLDILHMDIQGVELDALRGAVKSIDAGKVRFLFVSTHHYSISGDPITHDKCVDFIKAHGGHIIAKHSVLESCSGDGLVVASFDAADKNFTVPVSLQPVDDSLFRNAEQDLAIVWKSHDQLYQRVLEQEAEIRRLHELAASKQPLTTRAKKSLKRRAGRITKKIK
ncbi:MAG: hypothetical protein JWN38_708 [Candidatus Saccharibacteria bacterium]|nr:hypothetical protein [Candidatus Saccharibacteria bacterium]